MTQLFPSADERDTISDVQIQLAQETDPLILPPGYIASIYLPLTQPWLRVIRRIRLDQCIHP